MIIKIPFSQGSLGKSEGCSKGPEVITNLLKDIWTNEAGFNPKFIIKEIQGENFEELDNNIQNNLSFSKKTILLGGDHSISYTTFKKFKKQFQNVGLIIFDAHPDVYQEFERPTHGDWLKFLIEESGVDKDKVIIVGIRNSSEEELNYLKVNNIKYILMKNLFNNIEDVCDTIMETFRNIENIYLSVDIDVVDPAFAPGTGYNEPGGITSRELIYIVQRLKRLQNLRAIDIVEVNPEKDMNNITSKLAAKLIKEFF